MTHQVNGDSGFTHNKVVIILTEDRGLLCHRRRVPGFVDGGLQSGDLWAYVTVGR